MLVVRFQVMGIGRNAGQICMKSHELLGCVGEHAVLHIVGLLAKQESRAVTSVCAGLIESTRRIES